MTATGTASATVSVQASNYSVVVAAWAPCWTVVHSPQSFSPIFAATLQGGQVKVFDPTDGQLSVSMSASLVTVQVRDQREDGTRVAVQAHLGPVPAQLQLLDDELLTRPVGSRLLERSQARRVCGIEATSPRSRISLTAGHRVRI